MHGVAGDREAGSGDVLFTQVRLGLRDLRFQAALHWGANFRKGRECPAAAAAGSCPAAAEAISLSDKLTARASVNTTIRSTIAACVFSSSSPQRADIGVRGLEGLSSKSVAT